VDEALAVGDINFQAKCYRKFYQLQKAGKTIIFVTHALDTFVKYCNKGILLDHGRKIIEENPKNTVDIYKKILVDCYYKEEKKSKEENTHKKEIKDVWKQKFVTNKSSTIYGNNDAEIIDFGILDERGLPAQKLVNGDIFHIKMVVKFNKRIEEPIFAYTIKDLKGFEITGTNTFLEGIKTEIFNKNDVAYIDFAQTLNIKPGGYALSLGCTNYEEDKFVVYNRLYDILLFEVISEKQFVGMYDLKSKVSIDFTKK